MFASFRAADPGRRLQEIPGRGLLKYVDQDGVIRLLQSDDVNAFIRSATQGDHTARQFRTWAATVLTTAENYLLRLLRGGGFSAITRAGELAAGR